MAEMSLGRFAGKGAEYPVRLEVDPDTPQNRLLVFLRPILTIPHWIIIALLGIPFFFVWLIASASIVVLGRYPEPLRVSRRATPAGPRE